MNLKTRNSIYISIFIALITVSGFIKLNILYVPFTLQTLAVMLTACFLGVKRGIFAVLIYIFMGLLGISVFTKGGGLFYFYEPSFGYIIACLTMVIIIGIYKKHIKNIFMCISLLFISAILTLIIGTLYAYIILSATTQIEISSFIQSYLVIFIPAELLKSISASIIYFRLKSYEL